MSSLHLDVPALRLDRQGDVVVTRWGAVAGFTFRAGDRLVLGQEASDGLVLLRPRGYGWPMLGRRSGRGLVAEPGGVPAAPQRWQVVGGVRAVDRDLERAVADGGDWWVAVRVREAGSRRPVAIEALPARLQERFAGGRLSSAELDALCLRAALAPEQVGYELALGAAQSLALATELAAGAAFGAISIDVRGGISEVDGGRVIIGPWAEALTPAAAVGGTAAPGTVQLGLFDASLPDAEDATDGSRLRRSS